MDVDDANIDDDVADDFSTVCLPFKLHFSYRSQPTEPSRNRKLVAWIENRSRHFADLPRTTKSTFEASILKRWLTASDFEIGRFLVAAQAVETSRALSSKANKECQD